MTPWTLSANVPDCVGQAGDERLRNSIGEPNSADWRRPNPGGIAESSRWLSAFCDTTGSYGLGLHPGRGARSFPAENLAPLPGCGFFFGQSGGIAKNAQPPATFCNPSGIQSLQ